jgi:hypothetical protein
LQKFDPSSSPSSGFTTSINEQHLDVAFNKFSESKDSSNLESHLISVESQSKHRICPNNKQIRTLNSKNRLTNYNICQEIVQRNQQIHFTKRASASTLVQTQVVATPIELEYQEEQSIKRVEHKSKDQEEQTNMNTNQYTKSLESLEQFTDS